MAASVVPLFSRIQRSRDWTQQEVAEFYRVESSLIQAGLALESERGLTDEGDPWFVFLRADSGDVFIHFARFDGEYVAASAAFGAVRSRDFSVLVRSLLDKLPEQVAPRRRGQNVFMHPAAILIALVGAAFFHSGEAKAAETGPQKSASPITKADLQLLSLSQSAADAVAEANRIALTESQAATILSGIYIALAANISPPIVGSPGPVPSYAMADAGSPLVAPISPVVSSSANTPSTAPDQGPNLTVSPVVLFGEGQAQVQPTSVGVLTKAMVAADASSGYAPMDPGLSGSPTAAPAVVNPPQPAQVIDVAHLQVSGEAGLIVTVVDIIGNLQVSATFNQVEQLPATVEQLIDTGALVDSVTSVLKSPTTSQTDATVSKTAPPSAPSDSSAKSTGSSAHGDVSHSTPAAGPSAHDLAIKGFVDQFIAHVQSLEVYVRGHEIVLYDGQIFDTSAALDSVTFKFDDGSSISLVGTTTELLPAHLIH